jgi:hypothetical protein
MASDPEAQLAARFLYAVYSSTKKAQKAARDLLSKYRSMGMSEFRDYIAANPVTDSRVLGQLLIAFEETERRKRDSLAAKSAAEARHSKRGGSRDKRATMQKLWASGKYDSRDRCAEEEGRALAMSPSAARKALRNTPDPIRR